MKRDSKFAKIAYARYKFLKRKNNQKPIEGELLRFLIFTFVQFLKNINVTNAPFLFLNSKIPPHMQSYTLSQMKTIIFNHLFY